MGDPERTVALPSREPRLTEACAPERRRVLAIVAATNLAFAFVDLALFGATGWVVAGRALITAALLTAWWLVSRPAPSPALPRWLALVGVLVALGFSLLAAGSGDLASPYYAFIPFLPVVIGIIVPDLPGVPLATGVGAMLGGVVLAGMAGMDLPHRLLWSLAFASCTFYGWVSALLYERMRDREWAAFAARERALVELRQAEARQAHGDRLAALGRLTAGVAHEINNPLAFVATNLAFVREELGGAADPEIVAALDESRLGLERMKRIVQDMRGFARASGRSPEAIDAAAAVDEALRTAAVRLAGLVGVEVRRGERLPVARACLPELVQVLVNVLVNAADAIEAQPPDRRPGRVTVHLEPDGHGLRIAVEDSGPGFTEEAREHLFEPFFTSKGARGTGLGLALSREFVERWGGALEVGQAEGGGARVTVRLPPA